MQALPVTNNSEHHGDLSRKPYENPSASDPSELMLGKAVTIAPLRFWLLGIGVYIGLFLSAMDTSIVATSLHTIAVDFSVFTSVNWVALAYTLANCSCSVVFARISDIIGRRNAYVVAQILFFAFSLGCGFSQSLNQLIAFRTLQGIGGSGLYSLAMTILPEICPDHLLEYMAGATGLIIVVASVVGPLLGGVITQCATWRWIFWINAPISVISMVFFLVFWPREGTIQIPRRPWKSFDFAGSTVLILASVLTTFAFQNAGVSVMADIWRNAIFIAPVAVGLACWAVLFAWEYFISFRRASSSIMPVLPLSIFRNRLYSSGVITTLCLGFPMFVVIFSVPLRAQIVSGKSVLVAAVTLMPMLGASATGCVGAAAFNSRKNFLFESLLLGACLSTIGCALLTTIDDSGDDKSLMGYIVLVGLGGGLAIASATGLTGIEISPRHYAPAQGIVAQARMFGGSLGISTISVFLHNEIVRLVPPGASLESLALLSNPGTDFPLQLRSLVKEGCSIAFRNSMIVSAVIAGVGVLASLIGYQTTHLDPRQQRLDLVRAEARERLNEKD